MQYLPDKSTMFLTMTLMKTLSMRSLNPLGDWEVRYQFHQQVIEAENEYVQTTIKRFHKEVRDDTAL